MTLCMFFLVDTEYSSLCASTLQGGMKAVLFTDSFQVGMMFAGLIAILIQGNVELGGFEEAWKKAEEGGRVEFDE